ncbi:MAG: DinB family protein [Gemmatimonadota bacterium]
MTTRFLDASRDYLLDQYLPRIQLACQPLTDADIWWRPVEGSNSIGNLLLHIEGNARQWLIGGVGQSEGQRDRDGEFAAREGSDKATLLAHLTATFLEIDAVLARVTPAQLEEPRTIQGAATSVFDAIYHVVEHVSMHTGQVIQLAKWRAPGAVTLYEASSTAFTPLWQPTPRDGAR